MTPSRAARIARRFLPALVVALAAVMAWQAGRSSADDGAAAPGRPPRAEADEDSLRRYLEAFALDRQAREVLLRPGDWDDDRLAVAVRTLARLCLAPPGLAQGWRLAATPEGEIAAAPADRLVRVRGRARFVAPLRTPVPMALVPESPQGEPGSDVALVRVETEGGATVDILTPAAPRAWPRWEALDLPCSAWGLPLSSGTGPRPPADGAAAWPDGPPTLVLAAPRVAWQAPGLAGEAGFDAGLLDAVVDSRRLTAEDADAFYGLLAAAGTAGGGAIAAAAGAPRPIVPLIDPSQRWFERHRGEPVAVEGTALRATRVEIDDAWRRRQTGLDHYWELFVFVPTPPIEVAGKVQDRYPVVCCLRRLPPGMPTGPTIGERVRVAGFALKNYAYPLARPDGPPVRRDAPLLVGDDAEWLSAPKQAADAGQGAGLAILAAAVGAAVVAAGWWGARESARRRARRLRELPDRVAPPAIGPPSA